MLVYCSLCVCNLFIRAGSRGRWPASVKLVTLPYCDTFRVVVCLSHSLHGIQMPFDTYTCGVQWQIELDRGPLLPEKGQILGQTSSQKMQLQTSAKPSVLCCHLANTNEKLGVLATAIPHFATLLWSMWSWLPLIACLKCNTSFSTLSGSSWHITMQNFKKRYHEVHDWTTFVPSRL